MPAPSTKNCAKIYFNAQLCPYIYHYRYKEKGIWQGRTSTSTSRNDLSGKQKLKFGPGRDNEIGFVFEGHKLPKFFGDKRHKRMQKFQGIRQNVNQYLF